MLVEQYQMSLSDSSAVHVQVLMSGFWDEPKYHQRGRFNPRKVDELAALALSCRGDVKYILPKGPRAVSGVRIAMRATRLRRSP